MKNNVGPYAAEGAFRPDPRPTPKPTTDLEYREAAVRLAIAHFEAKGMKTTQQWEIVTVAKDFEEYLRNG